MGQGIEVANLLSANKLGIGPSNISGFNGGAAPVCIVDPSGNVISEVNRSAIDPATQAGLMLSGADYKSSRLVRVSPDGTLRSGEDLPLFYDSCEGAAVDTNKWIQTTTTMTITQAVATGVLLNAGASVATTVGAQHASQRRFAFIGRNAIVMRAKVRSTAHFNNNLFEIGLATAPAAATTAGIIDGAIWRKNGTGGYEAVVSINGSEVASPAPLDNATFATAVPANSYAIFSVFLEESRATFRIMTAGGVVVNEQVIEFGATIGTFGVTHLQAMYRTYNSGVVATAVQHFIAQVSVWQVDAINSPWEDIVAAMGTGGSLTSPLTTFAQLANYANSAAPANGTLSNTAAGYTTLGGQWAFAAAAGSEADFAFFAYQVPAPYAFRVRRVKITAMNTGAAVATTASVLQWGLAFNSSAVSLATGAPYTPMRKAIGIQSFPIAAAIAATVDPVEWEGNEVVQPGRFFHIILKLPIGTATASQVIRGTCNVEGHFLN